MIESNKAQKAHWIFDSYNILENKLRIVGISLKKTQKIFEKVTHDKSILRKKI